MNSFPSLAVAIFGVLSGVVCFWAAGRIRRILKEREMIRDKEQGRQHQQRGELAFEAGRIAAELSDEELAVCVKDAISFQDLGRIREGSPLEEMGGRLKDKFITFDWQVLNETTDAVALAVEREGAVRYCSKIPGFARVRKNVTAGLDPAMVEEIAQAQASFTKVSSVAQNNPDLLSGG